MERCVRFSYNRKVSYTCMYSCSASYTFCCYVQSTVSITDGCVTDVHVHTISRLATLLWCWRQRQELVVRRMWLSCVSWLFEVTAMLLLHWWETDSLMYVYTHCMCTATAPCYDHGIQLHVHVHLNTHLMDTFASADLCSFYFVIRRMDRLLSWWLPAVATLFSLTCC